MPPASATQSVGRDEDSSQRSGVVVRLAIPHGEFALADTFEAVPDAQFGAGSVAGAGGGVLPLLWARTANHERLETALEADSTTTHVARLTERSDEWLYQIRWETMVDIVAGLLTGQRGTILDATAEDGEWQMRVLYPTQSVLQEAMSNCERHDVSFDVESIRSVGGESTGQYGLTDPQYESMRAAFDEGYFSVPRETELSTLGGQMGVSHQALSERIRRGTKELVEQSLFGNRCGGQSRL